MGLYPNHRRLNFKIKRIIFIVQWWNQNLIDISYRLVNHEAFAITRKLKWFINHFDVIKKMQNVCPVEWMFWCFGMKNNDRMICAIIHTKRSLDIYFILSENLNKILQMAWKIHQSRFYLYYSIKSTVCKRTTSNVCRQKSEAVYLYFNCIRQNCCDCDEYLCCNENDNSNCHRITIEII